MQSMKGFEYVAVGLSTDQRMSNDSAMECVKDGDKVKLHSSLTEIKNGNYGAARKGIVSKAPPLTAHKLMFLFLFSHKTSSNSPPATSMMKQSTAELNVKQQQQSKDLNLI